MGLLTWEQRDAFVRSNAQFLVLACANAYRIAGEITKWASESAHEAVLFDEGDTQGFIAVHDGYVALSFRGTESDNLVDWRTDVLVRHTRSTAGGQVHRGFAAALDKVWDKHIVPVLARYPDRHLWITGHSLGGALAVLAASRVTDRSFSVYTFGQPRVGDAEFATACQARFGRRYFRFVHGRDIVPRVPPFTPGYRHFGWEVTAGHSGGAFQQGQACGVESAADAVSLAAGVGGNVPRKVVAFAPQLLNWVESAARGQLDAGLVRGLLDGFGFLATTGVREVVNGLKEQLADPKSLALGTMTDHGIALYRGACDLE